MKILTPDQFIEVLEDCSCNYESIEQAYSNLYSEYTKERNMNENYFKKLQPKKKETITIEPNPEPFPNFTTPDPELYYKGTPLIFDQPYTPKLPPHYPSIPNPADSTLDFHKCHLWIASDGHCSKCGQKL